MILNRHQIEAASRGTRVCAVGRNAHRGATYRRVTSTTWQAINRPTGDTPARVDSSRDLYAMGVELLEEP